MAKKKLYILFSIGMILLVMLACEFSASTANIKNAIMARDPNGNEPTTVFAPGDTFYCVVDLANAPDDTMVRAVWFAVNVEGVEPDYLIDEAELTTGGRELNFELSNTDPWLSGTYKVELYLNDELDRTLEFSVQ